MDHPDPERSEMTRSVKKEEIVEMRKMLVEKKGKSEKGRKRRGNRRIAGEAGNKRRRRMSPDPSSCSLTRRSANSCAIFCRYKIMINMSRWRRANISNVMMGVW